MSGMLTLDRAQARAGALSILDDVLELAAIQRPSWDALSAVAASEGPVCLRESDSKLREKLTQVEEDLDGLRDERAAAAQKREEAKEAFAAADGADVESDEFKAAEDAVRTVGELDDRIAQATETQVGILRMLGQADPDVAARREAAKGGNAKGSGWDSSAIFENEDVKAVIERAAGSKGHLGTIELGQVADRDAMVNMLAADISGTANMREAAYAGIVPQLRRPLRVLDLIPVGTIDGNSLPYTQEGGTFLAAETAEGGLKPEDGVTYTDATALVETIAAWQKIRKQGLSDFPALRSIIDGRLRYSVLRRLEAQVLAGNGTSPNLRGILNTSGIIAVPYAAGELADLILRGVTQVYLADAEATGIVLHPTDWETALKSKTAGSGEYFSGGPFTVTPQVMWGVPLVPSPAVAQGRALVGDFQIGASLLVREGVNVLMSDSDQDDFLRNRVTLLGEMRAALPVWRPAAFADVDLTP